MCDDPTNRNRPGFWLTAAKKEQCALYTRNILNEKRLRIHERLCTRIADAVPKLSMQMRNYKRVHRPQSTRSYLASDSRQQYIYSGKGGGQNDDLCVIMQETALLLPIMMGGHQRRYIYRPPERTLDEHLYMQTLSGTKSYRDRRADGNHAIGAPNMASMEAMG